jgi:transcription initiation factor TFIID subunit 5
MVPHNAIQPEFRPILFPIFCHFYLDLVQLGFKDAGECCALLVPWHGNSQALAQEFFVSFSPSLEPLHSNVIHRLSTLRLPAHIQSDETAQRFRSEKYTIPMTRSGFALLLGWLTEGVGGEAPGAGDGFFGEKGRRGRAAVMRVVNNHLKFDGTYCPCSSVCCANSNSLQWLRLALLRPSLRGRTIPVFSLRSYPRLMEHQPLSQTLRRLIALPEI